MATHLSAGSERQPEEIVNAVLWLSSPAGYVIAHVPAVDGGPAAD